MNPSSQNLFFYPLLPSLSILIIHKYNVVAITMNTLWPVQSMMLDNTHLLFFIAPCVWTVWEIQDMIRGMATAIRHTQGINVSPKRTIYRKDFSFRPKMSWELRWMWNCSGYFRRHSDTSHWHNIRDCTKYSFRHEIMFLKRTACCWQRTDVVSSRGEATLLLPTDWELRLYLECVSCL